MRIPRFVGPALAAAGIAVLAYGLARGEGTLSLVVVFPVITATGPWSAAGILLVVVGLFTMFLSWPFRPLGLPSDVIGEAASPAVPPAAPSNDRERRWGGVVFLGPFPIVFGSDSRITWAMLLVGVILFLVLLGLALLVILA